VDGILLIDKPAGKTSHDVVAGVRRGLRPTHPGRKGPKVGHAGTLDPFATGLLIVLVGRATRAQRFFMGLPKAYETVARFGAVSSTGDPEGEIVETGTPVPEPLVLPVGELRQRPPAYSAIKVGGERAYKLARRGEEVDMPERTVTVTRFDELWRDDDRAAFSIECSSGTYVRSLVADLGDAYCVELRRTRIGSFDVGAADPERLVPLGEALARVLPVVQLDDPDIARRAGWGQAVTVSAPPEGDHLLLVDADGPVAVAEPRGAELKPTVGFRGS
jgi:tRNA pseudouridine55 synthase